MTTDDQNESAGYSGDAMSLVMFAGIIFGVLMGWMVGADITRQTLRERGDKAEIDQRKQRDASREKVREE